MIYRLKSGETIDTAQDLTFEERNLVQKMLIHARLGLDLEAFREKWRRDDSPAWKGPQTLVHPSPAARILLDLEERITAG
jgi:hypothetical protein